MKPSWLLTAFISAWLAGSGLIAFAAAASGEARRTVGIQTFYESLAPYGTWFTLANNDWAWCPSNVAIGWRPYAEGSWVYTDYGWTWASDEPFGWATYHYGRWTYDGIYGWVWVPGTVWGPAWVDWRYGDGWIGWAPLPPEIGWSPGVGLEFPAVDITTIIPASCYSFVREDVFVDKHINRRIVIPARNVTLVKATNRLTEDRLVDGVLMNNSVSVDRVEQVLHRAVPRMKIIDADSAASLNVSFNGKRAKGDEVAMFRPHIETSGTGGTAPPPFAATSPQSAAPALPPAGVLERQHAEHHMLDKQETASRRELEREHEKEMKAAESNRSLNEELMKRQEAERHALDEQMRRNREVMEARHERERAALPPASAPSVAKHHR